MFAGAGPARAADLPADTLTGRIVRRVEVRAFEIFDPLPAGRLRGLYALANRLHVRTRESTIRTAVVARPGARWSAGRRAESERRLRALDFLVPDSVVAVPVAGSADSVDVLVTTHDNWTTSPEATLESGGGQRYGSLAFTERNLAGLGITVTATYREEPAGISRFLWVEDPAIAGTHWRARFLTGNGDTGKRNGAEFGLPFWADDAPITVGGAWSREVSQAQLWSRGEEVAQVPLREEMAEARWGTGRRAADGTVQRFVATYRAYDRRLGVSVLEPDAPAEFGGSEEELRLRRLEGEVTLWRPDFRVRRGVDFMDREEDFDLGTLTQVGVGVAPRAFGSGADEGWLYGRLGAGVDRGPAGFGLASTEFRTRVRSGLRESFARVRVRWIVQPRPGAALVAAVEGAAGRRMPRNFQLSAGGLTGLRGFPVQEVAGTQLWRANAEARWTLRHAVLQLATFGGAVFWDTARAYGPGSGGESWHHDAGFGLRVSLPHSALNAVARFDIAWPIAPAVDGRRGPAYSFGSGQAF
ncbi:MAG: hypothetical protein IT347_06085 [Candidatus Eisenbacteria bacterium]|nr:hypothetical protein [Candidatus Eisenbacteria bacterium]